MRLKFWQVLRCLDAEREGDEFCAMQGERMPKGSYGESDHAQTSPMREEIERRQIGKQEG